MEFNSKFQAIQSAHEVLTDTQQRAKYDADRIRAGLLHTYTSPMRPNMPPRSAATTTNYPPPPPPPPPRPPPASTTKATFPPPPSGAHRYTRNQRPAPVNTENDVDAARAKVNAFKAWDQMRHGTGQPPQGRSMPPKSPRTSTYQPSTPGTSGLPNEPPPKRSGWDQFQEARVRFPGTTRSRPGFDPSADDPSVRYKSAYSNVSRGDHPPSRSRTTYAPTQQVPGTSPTKPDPLRAFKAQTGFDDPLSNSTRVSTPYATTGGEKTYFSSTGLGRSASTRESKEHGQWYDSDPSNVDNPHNRAKSATSSRQHHSASPNTRNSMPPAASFSSESSSSSDESVADRGKKPYAPMRQPRGPPRPQAQNPFGGHRRPSSKPTVQVAEAMDDDDLVPLGQAKQKAAETPHNTTSGYPEGFNSHRAKRHSDRSQEQSPPKSDSTAQDPSKRPQRPVQKSQSWYERSSSANGNENEAIDPACEIGDQARKPSMYDFFGYTQSPITPSLSMKWSDQWPFKSPKQPRTSSALPPYWAIPSSLAPRKQQEAPDPPHDIFNSFRRGQNEMQNFADIVSPSSFKMSVNDKHKVYAGTPSLRSHSSDTINVNFSPSDWDGKFTGNANDYFVPPPPSRGNAPRGRTSPVRRQQPRQQAPIGNERTSQTANVTAPPSSASEQSNPAVAAEQGQSSQEEWVKHLKPASWDFLPPPPPGSPTRTSRKRPIAARKPSKTTTKRSAAPKAVSVSATLDDSGEENEAESNTSVSSSKTSGGGSAMDIDPILTPPSAEQPKTNGNEMPAQADQTNASPRLRGPALPPRSNENLRNGPNSFDLNLGDLKNVAPFAPSQSGLGDLNDLSATLPFESRPSLNPFNIHTPQPLILPSPPKSILVPANLTQTSWERYLAQMRAYMFEWNMYNTKMLEHFNQRQTSIETTFKPDWMSAVGEGNEKWGYTKYMQGVEEDFRVREHWDVSWERHKECMKGLGVMRDRVLGGRTVTAS